MLCGAGTALIQLNLTYLFENGISELRTILVFFSLTRVTAC